MAVAATHPHGVYNAYAHDAYIGGRWGWPHGVLREDSSDRQTESQE
jgi:hypothetical protein